MESLEVIAKVTEPTWVNSVATPEKQRTGALRVCLDPRDLNQAVKREHYPLPTLEELTLMLSDGKYFSVLDATSGYWQIKLDECIGVYQYSIGYQFQTTLFHLVGEA